MCQLEGSEPFWNKMGLHSSASRANTAKRGAGGSDGGGAVMDASRVRVRQQEAGELSPPRLDDVESYTSMAPMKGQD